MSHRLLRRSSWDLVKSMYLLRSPAPLITVFASARLGADTAAHPMARDLGHALAKAGFAVMTGGGPGLMEAVNRGAREAGGPSLGCRMAFPFEQAENRFLDRCTTVRYFFVRKVVMCRPAVGFAALPGGLGTLDELFDVLTLIQTKRMRAKPIVLLGRAFWEPLLILLEKMIAAGTIPTGQLPVITVTDDVSEAVAFFVHRRASAGSDPLEPSGRTARRLRPVTGRLRVTRRIGENP
jgi:uncharacterized protein (TIGR00730 family)